MSRLKSLIRSIKTRLWYFSVFSIIYLTINITSIVDLLFLKPCGSSLITIYFNSTDSCKQFHNVTLLSLHLQLSRDFLSLHLKIEMFILLRHPIGIVVVSTIFLNLVIIYSTSFRPLIFQDLIGYAFHSLCLLGLFVVFPYQFCVSYGSGSV